MLLHMQNIPITCHIIVIAIRLFKPFTELDTSHMYTVDIPAWYSLLEADFNPVVITY